MATREFHFELTNTATATPPGAPVVVGIVLKKSDDRLCHGIWTGGVRPPDVINPGETVTWASESDGIMTGTVGRMKYDIVAADATSRLLGKLALTWGNPFVGSTDFDPLVSASDIAFKGSDSCDIDHGEDSSKQFAT